MNSGTPFTDAFNRLEVTSGVFRLLQDAKERAILDRLVDDILQPGVQIPANSTAIAIQNGVPTQFAITSAGANITIGAGVAYNNLGQRIVVPVGDTTPYNINAPTFTSTITGVGAVQGTTPYSTGNTGVPPLNPNTLTTRFIFIQYVQVIHTKALPPNHNTVSPAVVVTIAGGDPDTKKPLTELDEKEGLIYAPHRIDGYKIITAELSGLTVGSQASGTPVLNADTTAIYIGRYDLIGGPPATGVTNVFMSDALRPRKLFLTSSETGAKVDVANKTPNYADQQVVSAQEHVSALGTGTVTPVNPHGMTITDLGVSLPDLTTALKETMEDGIIDLLLDRNTPIPAGEVLESAITAPTQLTFTNFIPGRHVMYIQGERFVSLTSLVLTFSTEPAGTYVIFAQKSTGTVALLGRQLLTSPLAVNQLAICTVFWTGVLLRKEEFRDSSAVLPAGGGVETPPVPIDRRSFGLIGTPQVSSQAMSDPTKGFFSNEIFTNRAFNPNFEDRWGSPSPFLVVSTAFVNPTTATFLTQSAPHGWDFFDVVTNLGLNVGTIGAAGFQVIDGTVDSDPTFGIRVSGPKVNSALRLKFASGTASQLDVKVRGRVAGLKPNTTYVVSAWIKVTAVGNPGGSVNTSINIMTAFRNNTGGFPNTQLSSYQELPFVNNLTPPAWQRVSALVKTNSSASVLDDNRIEFRFIAQSTLFAFTNADIYMTDISVTEGEWFVSNDHLRPQGFQLTGFLNPGGQLNNVGGNGPSAPRIVMSIAVPTRGQFVSIQGGLSVDDGQNAPSEIALPTCALTIDGTIVSVLMGKLDNLNDVNPRYSITFPFRVSFAGYLTPGVHTINLYWQSFSTNPFMGNIPIAYSTRPEMSLLLL